MSFFELEEVKMSLAGSLNKPSFYVHVGIMIAVMLVFRLLTPPEGLTAEGLAVIGIFFGILYGWLFIDVVWPSLLGLVFLGLTLQQPWTACWAAPSETIPCCCFSSSAWWPASLMPQA